MGDRSRVPMEAVIVEVVARRGRGGGPDDGEFTTLDAVGDYFGSETWNLVLDVSPSSGDRFRHAGRYKISNRLGGVRRTFKRWRPLPGLAVPVLVSPDRTGVDIDWDAFVVRGGIEHDEFSRYISSLVQGGALNADEGSEFLRQAGLL